MADWGSTSEELFSSFRVGKDNLLKVISILPADHREIFVKLLISELIEILHVEPSELTTKILYDLMPQLKHNQRGELAVIVDMYAQPSTTPTHIIKDYGRK